MKFDRARILFGRCPHRCAFCALNNTMPAKRFRPFFIPGPALWLVFLTGLRPLCKLLHNERRCAIATNLDIDQALLKETLTAWGFKTKKETVNTALSELLKKKKRLELVEMFGKVDYYPDYDHKKLRSRKRK